MTSKICNERGISIKHVIIGGGIGIFIAAVLLSLSVIPASGFIWLMTLIVFTCLFVFYEPRIKNAKATKDGVELEMYKAIFIKQEQVEPMPPVRVNFTGGGWQTELESYGTDEQAKLVIKSIGGTKYTFRNIEGIVADSNLPEDIARDKLNWLMLHDFVDEFEISGEKLYALSLKGHSVFSGIKNQT